MFFLRPHRSPVLEGVFLALLVVLVCWGILRPPGLASGQAPLFSVTVIVPSGANEVRQSYAKTVVQNMIAEGIDAKLVVANFDQLVNRMFATTGHPGSSYDQGGYDVGFIGWGYTSFVPDFGSNFGGRAFPPSGNDYAYYNSPMVNSILSKLSLTTDTATQVQLTHQLQEQVFNDAPYNYIYEAVDPVPRASR